MKTVKHYIAILVLFLAIGLNKTSAQSDEFSEETIQPEVENLIGLTLNDIPVDNITILISGVKTINTNPANIAPQEIGLILNSKDDGKETTMAINDEDDEPVVDKEEILIRMGRGDTRIIYDDPNINLYPNPAVNFVNFDLTEEFNRIEIYNLIGSMVNQIDISENVDTKIDLSELNSGIYMINFIGDDKVSSKKLAVRK